jgi:hypothetical protein
MFFLIISKKKNSLIIEFLMNKNPDHSSLIGYFYAFILFIICIINSCMTQQYFHRYLIVGLRIQTAITCLVYKKVIFVQC